MTGHIENWIRVHGSFKKSSFSSEGDCVEVTKIEIIGVRNSNDPQGPLVLFTQDEWDAFADGMLAGEFDDIRLR